MSNNRIVRTTKFVSLDTHPAKDALVVTYDVVASLLDPQLARQLTTVSKRHQLQVEIGILDKLARLDGDKNEKLVINLQELKSQVLQKCPLLAAHYHNEARSVSSMSSSSSPTQDDIELHLLYLINRRQAQLVNPAATKSDTMTTTRPMSTRPRSSLRSARPQSRLSRPSTSMSASSKLHNKLQNSQNPNGSMYKWMLARERELECQPLTHLTDSFVVDLRDKIEFELAKVRPEWLSGARWASSLDTASLDAYLEGLYGDRDEKLDSLAKLWTLSQSDEHLWAVGSNRLLVSALIRNLRDLMSSSPNQNAVDELCELMILYCILRLSSYADLYESSFQSSTNENQDSFIDLVKLYADLLANMIKVALTSRDTSLVISRHYYLTSLQCLMVNLISVSHDRDYVDDDDDDDGDEHEGSPVARRLVCNRQISLAISGLLQLSSVQLSKDARVYASKKLHLNLSMLQPLLAVLNYMSLFKQFVHELHRTTSSSAPSSATSSSSSSSSSAANQQQVNLAHLLVNLICVLQFARQSATSSDHDNSGCPLDQDTLNQMYELELSCFGCLNNVILHKRLRSRLFARSQLLKCTLRSLASFVASVGGGNWPLDQFEGSRALLLPLKCLYLLTCLDEVRAELFKSRIITKCLLEYLVRSVGRSRKLTTAGGLTAMQRIDVIGAHEDDHECEEGVTLRAQSAHEYILASWINLSARREAPIYVAMQAFMAGEDDSNQSINELLLEYLELSATGLADCVKCLLNDDTSDDKTRLLARNLVYMDMKLFRNMTQFMAELTKDTSNKSSDTQNRNKSSCQQLAGASLRWLDELARASELLVSMSPNGAPAALRPWALALQVETLASMANLLVVCGRPANSISRELMSRLASLLARLLSKFISDEQQRQDGLGDPQSAAKTSCLDSTQSYDDLLLVVILFIANLVENHEICSSSSPSSRQNGLGIGNEENIALASKLVLASKHSDSELRAHCLYALGQLMGHVGWLHKLGQWFQGRQATLEQLVGLLCELTLDRRGKPAAATLASSLVERLRQLEQQQQQSGEPSDVRPSVAELRFLAYNAKWLGAIRNNEGDDEDDDDCDHDRQPSGSTDDEGLTGPFELLGDAADMEMMMGTGDRNEITVAELELDDDYDVEATDSEGIEEPPAAAGANSMALDEFAMPDLNVIDANSMIRHLVANGGLKQQQQSQQQRRP